LTAVTSAASYGLGRAAALSRASESEHYSAGYQSRAVGTIWVPAMAAGYVTRRYDFVVAGVVIAGDGPTGQDDGGRKWKLKLGLGFGAGVFLGLYGFFGIVIDSTGNFGITDEIGVLAPAEELKLSFGSFTPGETIVDTDAKVVGGGGLSLGPFCLICA